MESRISCNLEKHGAHQKSDILLETSSMSYYLHGQTNIFLNSLSWMYQALIYLRLSGIENNSLNFNSGNLREHSMMSTAMHTQSPNPQKVTIIVLTFHYSILSNYSIPHIVTWFAAIFFNDRI